MGIIYIFSCCWGKSISPFSFKIAVEIEQLFVSFSLLKIIYGFISLDNLQGLKGCLRNLYDGFCYN